MNAHTVGKPQQVTSFVKISKRVSELLSGHDCIMKSTKEHNSVITVREISLRAAREISFVLIVLPS